MNQSLDTLFQKLPTILPQQSLADSILARIEGEERKTAKTQQNLWGFAGIASFVGTVALSINLVSYLSHSGFFEYLSLVTSEQGSILNFSKELGLALVESMPIAGSALLLATVGLLIWSLSAWSKNTRTLFALA